MSSADASGDRSGPVASLSTPTVVGLRDRSVADQLARSGFARLGPLLGDDEVAAAREVFTDAVRMISRPIGERWIPTALLPEVGVRDEISRRLSTIIGPKLPAVLDPDQVELMQLQLSVKPASPDSELGPHQDFSVVDERKATSLYLWIPLEDMDERNGTLHVVPGSHRFAPSIRSQHVPSTFDLVMPEVHEAALRLDCHAGELILMVSGVIHFSPPNRGDDTRLAAHGILKPVGAPLIFFYADENTPAGMVEAYETDMASYVDQVTLGRPSRTAGSVTMVPRPETMTRERFLAGLAATWNAR